MKIALIGYGRMGQTIERLALERGHEIVLRIYPEGDSLEKLKEVATDIAIDFSLPDFAFHNICFCFEHNIPVVSGTTGWLDKYDEAVRKCKSTKSAFIYASNFSLGVNLFFELNRKLAKLMKPFDSYDVSMKEIHHVKKLDAPSGTAITLAEGLIENKLGNAWSLSENKKKGDITIEVERTPEVPGTHIINYNSPVDEISIKHTALNRDGFALGAIIAAEWLIDKNGVFTMQDVLNL